MRLRLFALAAALSLTFTPALAASTTVKSGQTIDGATSSAPVVQPVAKKLCWDGSTIDLSVDCPLVPAPPAQPTVINASTSTNGVFTFAVGTTTGATIRNYTINNPYRAIEAPTGAKVDGLVVENITAANLQRGFIRLHGNHNVTLRHITAAMRDAPQTGSSNLPACITSQGENETGGLLIQDAHCSGFYWELADQTAYGNGDGADLDDQNAGCQPTVLDSSFTDNSDGGIDVKCPEFKGDNITVANDARGVRAWYGGDIGTLTCGDMVRKYGTGGTACVWIENTTKYPQPGLVHLRHLIVNFTKAANIIVIDGKAKVVVDSCTLNVPAGTKLVSGSLLPGSSFGPGCTVQ